MGPDRFMYFVFLIILKCNTKRYYVQNSSKNSALQLAKIHSEGPNHIQSLQKKIRLIMI